MIKVVVAVICSFLTSQIFAQAGKGDIEMKKSFWVVKFHQDGKSLETKEVFRILKTNPDAYAEFKKAKANYDAAFVFEFLGGFMIGWPIGTAIAGGDPKWGLAAGGGGCILISIMCSNAFSKHIKGAIKIHNNDSRTASNHHPYSLQVMPHGAGAKFILKF